MPDGTHTLERVSAGRSRFEPVAGGDRWRSITLALEVSEWRSDCFRQRSAVRSPALAGLQNDRPL